MNEEELRKSGLYYLECPICHHVFSSIEKKRNDICFLIKCYCKNCDQQFEGTDDGKKVQFKSNGLFSNPDYIIEWKQGE